MSSTPRTSWCVWLLLTSSCERALEIPRTSGDPPAVVPGTEVSRLKDDAGEDGWDTEVFNTAADHQLQVIGKFLESSAPIDAQSLGSVAAADVTSSRLRPEDLEEVFRDPSFVVRQLRAVPSATGAPYRGVEGLANAVRELAEAVRGGTEIHVKFKIFRVELLDGGTDASGDLPDAGTTAYFQLSGRTPAGVIQLQSTWRSSWARARGQAFPLLRSITLEAHEEALGSGAMFADCTEAVLRRNPSFDAQLRHGVDHWTARIDASLGIDIGGWQGLAVGDVNGDGLDDVYLPQPGGLPNRLFLQDPGGTATDASVEAGVDWLDSTHAALLVDLDNDGDQDLLLSVDPGILILANDGKGRFTVASAEVLPAAVPYSLAAADYDSDGDLDIYVTCYNPRAGINRHLLFARPVPYHDANNGGPSVLLRNDGKWRFTHATKQVGLDEHNRRFSYAASWEDYDNDGDLDLYVANDFGRDNLYRNEGGRFTEVAASAGVDDISPGMSTSWGDYDNDGLMDLYVSNMFSSAGNRITFQEKFQSGSSEKTRSELQRHARGNTLFRNLGNGTFKDVSVEAGVVLGRWAWGSMFLDLQNDGWEDILVTNGFITQAEDRTDL